MVTVRAGPVAPTASGGKTSWSGKKIRDGVAARALAVHNSITVKACSIFIVSPVTFQGTI
jgi:hypothetical protein